MRANRIPSMQYPDCVLSFKSNTCKLCISYHDKEGEVPDMSFLSKFQQFTDLDETAQLSPGVMSRQHMSGQEG